MAKAVALGKQDVWEKEEAVVNVDGSVGVSAFDGFMRLGTNREILSWPGVDPYLVKTEGDEAEAQARLKGEREDLRERQQSKVLTQHELWQQAKKTREDEFARRQAEARALEQQLKEAEKRARRQAFAQMSRDWPAWQKPDYTPDRSTLSAHGEVMVLPRIGRSAARPSAGIPVPMESMLQLISRTLDVKSPTASPESPA